MAQPISRTLAETYLRARGITSLHEIGSLRFHPRCFFRPDEHSPTEIWPAIVASVTDLDGRQTGAHRTWLLFGERTAAHDFHFGEELQAMLADGTLARLDAVFSRDGGAHRYVQDRLLTEAATLRQWVDEGATILVCGSLQGMAPAVDAVIDQALGRDGKEALIVAGRYRRDVY